MVLLQQLFRLGVLSLPVLLLVPEPATAQQHVPVAKLDTSAILIGEQVKLDLSVTYRADAGITIQWPNVADTISRHISVLHDSRVDTVLPDKANDPFLFRQQRTLTITSWDSGFWAIPPFHFIVNGDTLETAPLLLTVNTVPVDTAQDFRDIKEIYTLPFSIWHWLQENWRWIAGGAVALAVLTVLFIVLYRRSRRPRPQAPVPPPVPVHTRTLLALEALQQKNLWQSGHTKAYYSELTDILRNYLQERYSVPAMEQTTDELLAALRLSPMTKAAQEKLRPLLQLADMVKFAKWQALPAENEQAMASAVRLVQETAEPYDHAPLA